MLADEVGGEGGEDDTGHGAEDGLEGFLMIPEACGGEDLGHVNQEDHYCAQDEAHPDEPGGGLTPIEFRDGVGDKEGEGVGNDAGGDGPAIDVEEFDSDDVGDNDKGCEGHGEGY